jgi:hypothetical protein
VKNPANASKDNMRHGLISLLTVVVVISIATAAVLTVATSRAMAALAERQATMTTEGYAAEQSAQTMLSYVDEELLASRKAKESRQAMLSRIENRMNSLLVEACEPGVSATYVLDGNVLTCTFVTEGGRSLEASVTIQDDATYTITAWRLTAVVQETTSDDTLWTGSTAKE